MYVFSYSVHRLFYIKVAYSHIYWCSIHDQLQPLGQTIVKTIFFAATYQPAGKRDTGQFTITNTAAVEGEGASTEQQEKAGLLQDKN